VILLPNCHFAVVKWLVLPYKLTILKVIGLGLVGLGLVDLWDSRLQLIVNEKGHNRKML